MREAVIVLCKEIETFAPEYGCHIALTGGNLYKDGSRKDLDILFYRIRQRDTIDRLGLEERLRTIGFDFQFNRGWISKALYRDQKIDIFYPEHVSKEGDDYQ